LQLVQTHSDLRVKYSNLFSPFNAIIARSWFLYFNRRPRSNTEITIWRISGNKALPAPAPARRRARGKGKPLAHLGDFAQWGMFGAQQAGVRPVVGEREFEANRVRFRHCGPDHAGFAPVAAGGSALLKTPQQSDEPSPIDRVMKRWAVLWRRWPPAVPAFHPLMPIRADVYSADKRSRACPRIAGRDRLPLCPIAAWWRIPGWSPMLATCSSGCIPESAYEAPGRSHGALALSAGTNGAFYRKGQIGAGSAHQNSDAAATVAILPGGACAVTERARGLPAFPESQPFLSLYDLP